MRLLAGYCNHRPRNTTVFGDPTPRIIMLRKIGEFCCTLWFSRTYFGAGGEYKLKKRALDELKDLRGRRPVRTTRLPSGPRLGGLAVSRDRLPVASPFHGAGPRS